MCRNVVGNQHHNKLMPFPLCFFQRVAWFCFPNKIFLKKQTNKNTDEIQLSKRNKRKRKKKNHFNCALEVASFETGEAGRRPVSTSELADSMPILRPINKTNFLHFTVKNGRSKSF